MKKIFEKLLNVQSELKSPKSQYNSFAKFYFRNCEDILESVKPLLKENGLTMIITDEVLKIDERYYVKSTVTVIDVESGDSISNSALAREEETKKGMDGSQITGATSSYARKYALNGMFLIDDNKDSDTTNTGEQGNAAKFESMWVGLNEEQKKWFENKYKKDYSKFTKKEKEEAYEILMKKKEK